MYCGSVLCDEGEFTPSLKASTEENVPCVCLLTPVASLGLITQAYRPEYFKTPPSYSTECYKTPPSYSTECFKPPPS